MYIDFGVENNGKDSKFKVGDCVRISKYENTFAKGHTEIWSRQVFVIKSINKNVLWTYVVEDLNGEEIAENFYG